MNSRYVMRFLLLCIGISVAMLVLLATYSALSQSGDLKSRPASAAESAR